MRTGALVMVGIGLAVLALVGWSVHDKAQEERIAAVAKARRVYSIAVYATRTEDIIASMGSRRLGEARYQKASADYAQARSESDAAERAYIEACKVCAPAAECERDRLVIASGRSGDAYNPCER